MLLDEAKVAIVPGEAFGAPGYARLSFALGDDDLGEGVPPHRRLPREVSGAAPGIVSDPWVERAVSKRVLVSEELAEIGARVDARRRARRRRAASG